MSVFSNILFRCFMSWSGNVQVYNRFTRDFGGYFARVFLMTTHEVKILVSSLIIFFWPASKKPIAFNYSTVWSSLIICSRLTNARDSLKFNMHSGKLRILVTCFWIYWFIDHSIPLRWDTIVLYSPPDLIRGQRLTRLWVVVKYPLIWDLMLHPNTKL